MASGTTSRAGYPRARAFVSCQWVVTRRPSSSPAAARMNVPVQIVAVRCARVASVRAALTIAGLIGSAGISSEPTMSAISSGPLSSAAASTLIRIPVEETTSRPSVEYNVISYSAPARLASLNTSLGPATSSKVAPS